MKKALLICLILLCAAGIFAGSLSDVNSFDRSFAKSYSKELDNVGTALQLATMALPVIAVINQPDRFKGIALSYSGTVALTYGIKELVKYLVPRERPYTYFSGAPVEEVADWCKSFPSGHAALAFAGASFTCFWLVKNKPQSKWKIPLIGLCSALALATSVSRVQAGCHFPTDVIAGAAVGILCGVGAPLVISLKY